MAHFSDCGVHCADPYCQQKDFLPVTCDACGKQYCSDHFKYEAHNCEKGRKATDKRVIVCPICQEAVDLPAGEDPNAVWERHAASGCKSHAPPPKPKCPVSGCKEKLTSINSVTCGACGKTVCMKHRFEDTHDCRPPQSRLGAPIRKTSSAACRNDKLKSMWGQMGQAAEQMRRLVK